MDYFLDFLDVCERNVREGLVHIIMFKLDHNAHIPPLDVVSYKCTINIHPFQHKTHNIVILVLQNII